MGNDILVPDSASPWRCSININVAYDNENKKGREHFSLVLPSSAMKHFTPPRVTKTVPKMVAMTPKGLQTTCVGII